MAAEDGSGLFDWSDLPGIRVIRYDARGHGSSSGPLDPVAYTWRRLGADMLAVLTAAGVDHSSIGGASMGCATAIYAALDDPERVDRLVLATPPTAWDTRRPQQDLYARTADLLERNGTAALVEVGRADAPPAVLGQVGDHLHRDSLERLATTDPHILRCVLRGAATSDLPAPELLAHITKPSLVLAWTDDPGHPLSTAELIAQSVPDCELHVAHDLDAVKRWPTLVGKFLDA